MAKLDFSTKFGRRVRGRLQSEHVLWLTTVDAGGTPQPRPVWFHWDGKTLLIYSKPNTGKVRHIARNPRVALHFNTDAAGNDFAVFLGQARIPARKVPRARLEAYLRKYKRAIPEIGMTRDEFTAAYSVPILVRPAQMRGW